MDFFVLVHPARYLLYRLEICRISVRPDTLSNTVYIWDFISTNNVTIHYTDANFKSYNIRQQHTVQQQRTTAATYNNNIQQNQCITTIYNNSNGQQHTTTTKTYKRIELERFFSFNRINTLTFEDVKLKVCNHVNSYEKDYIGGYWLCVYCYMLLQQRSLIRMRPIYNRNPEV